MAYRYGFFFLVALGALMADATEISITATQNVGTAELKKDSLIHSNRDYCYRTFPKMLDGKSYILHDHRKTSDLGVKVVKGGISISVFLTEIRRKS